MVSMDSRVGGKSPIVRSNLNAWAMTAVSSSRPALIGEPDQAHGHERERQGERPDDRADETVDHAEDRGEHEQPDGLAVVVDVLRQEPGQDVERDRGDDRPDDEASQGGASELVGDDRRGSPSEDVPVKTRGAVHRARPAIRPVLDGRPLLRRDAEVGGMPDGPVGHDHVVPEDALERRADARQRIPRSFVARVRLELDPLRVERLERVGQLEQLRLAVRAGPLPGRADPRPADLETAVLGHDRQEPAAADRPAGRSVDRRERSFDARGGVGKRRLQPAPEARLVLRTHDRPAPQRRVEGDPREVVEVVRPERLQADAIALEDDRFDPRLRCHRRMVDRSTARMPG